MGYDISISNWRANWIEFLSFFIATFETRSIREMMAMGLDFGVVFGTRLT